MWDAEEVAIRQGLVDQWTLAVSIQYDRVADVGAREAMRLSDCDLLVLAVHRLCWALEYAGNAYPGDVTATTLLRHALEHPEDRGASLAYTFDGQEVDIAAVMFAYRSNRTGPRKLVVSRLLDEAWGVLNHARTDNR